VSNFCVQIKIPSKKYEVIRLPHQNPGKKRREQYIFVLAVFMFSFKSALTKAALFHHLASIWWLQPEHAALESAEPQEQPHPFPPAAQPMHFAPFFFAL
jgi:hypothetical protein